MAIYSLITCGNLEVTIASNEYYFTVSRDGKPVGTIARPYTYLKTGKPYEYNWNGYLLNGNAVNKTGNVGPRTTLQSLHKALYGKPGKVTVREYRTMPCT